MLVDELSSFGTLKPLDGLGALAKSLGAGVRYGTGAPIFDAIPTALLHKYTGQRTKGWEQWRTQRGVKEIAPLIEAHVKDVTAHHALPTAVPAGAQTTPPSGPDIKDAEVKAMTEQLAKLVDERMIAIEKRFSDWKQAQVEAELKLREERAKRDQETAVSKAEADSLKKDLAAALEQSSVAQKKREVEIAAESVATQVATGKISLDKGRKEIAKAIAGGGVKPYLPYIIGGVVILGSLLLWVLIRRK